MSEVEIINADYFINFFEKIPEEKWCVGAMFEGGKACAQGHCINHYSGSDNLRQSLLDLFGTYSLVVIRVNDIQSDEFPQPTPKQRILAALQWIKSKESQCTKST